jgi:hypothetical protein
VVGPKQKREAANFLTTEYDVSKRKVAVALGLNWSTFTFKPKGRDDSAIEEKMRKVVTKHRRFGLPRVSTMCGHLILYSIELKTDED